ncbi:MAG: IclR family transcriptional regulator [Desulfuromusa sp.]|nr:IclR family transcriptional regulator [Desulfuromusa sp.]
MESSKNDRYFLKSLANGIRVLEIVAESDCPVTLSEIATKLDTTKTTATRICYTLTELKFLHKNENNKYCLTPKNLKFGYGSLKTMGWRGIAKTYLEKLFSDVQETIALTILDGTDVLFLMRMRQGNFFPFNAGVGTKLPAHCASTGKAMLAFLPQNKRQSILDRMSFKPLTVHSIKSAGDFTAELAVIREKGFAANYEEVSIGVCGISAPILDVKGEPIAGISISSDTTKYTKSALEEKLGPIVVNTAKQISEALIHIDVPEIY